MKNRLSATGTTLRLNDSPPTTSGDIFDDASATIEAYMLLHYAPDQLAASRWVKHAAADIATFLLCERRGDPVPVGAAQKFERRMAELERIQAGGMKVADIPMRRTAVPVMSNMRPSNRPFPHAVVERSRSTHKPRDYIQNLDPWDQVNQMPDYVI